MTNQVWKVLSKYHNLPDHFHDLKTILQTEFNLLKTATSKNMQNIQEVVNSQQAYTMVLSGHINTLYTKLAHLDRQVQMKKTGTTVHLMMQSFSTIITLPRKVTEYIMSTLLTLKKSKSNNTPPTILCKVLNIIFLSQITITTTHNQNSTQDSKTKMYTYPHHPLPRTYIHGTVEAEEELGI